MYRLRINEVDIVPTSGHELVFVHIESDNYNYTFTPNIPTLVETLHALMSKSFSLDVEEFTKLLNQSK